MTNLDNANDWGGGEGRSQNRLSLLDLIGNETLSIELAAVLWLFVENKKYTSKVFKQPLEIVSLIGNITTMDNEVYLHCHITLGDEEMKAIVGHLKEGKIAATCEIILAELNGEIDRKHDDFIGLNLLDIYMQHIF